MRYKNNYVSLITDKLPLELQDKILNMVFNEHNDYLYKKNKVYGNFDCDLENALFEYTDNKIKKHFCDSFADEIPFQIRNFSSYDELTDIEHEFNKNNTEPTIYINRINILNLILNFIDYDDSDSLYDYLQETDETITIPLICEFDDKIDEKEIEEMTNDAYTLTKEDIVREIIISFLSDIDILNRKFGIELEYLYGYCSTLFLEDISIFFDNENKLFIDFEMGSYLDNN